MCLPNTRSRITRVFYAVVLTLVSSAAAATDSSWVKNADRLERETQAAYESTDPDAAERLHVSLNALLNFYRENHRYQEMAWTHFNYGSPAEGEAIERELLLRMAGEVPMFGRGRVVEHSARIESLVYQNGFKAVLVTPDLRLPGEPVAAGKDQRRYGVVVYQMARALGFNIVPATEFTELDKHHYLTRAYIDDLTEIGRDHRVQPYFNEQLHVLDYLTGQLDRNPTGVGIRPGGHVVAFDNRHALGFKDSEHVDKGLVLPAQRPPLSLSRATRTAVLGLKKKLGEFHHKRFAMLADSDRRDVMARIEVLLALPARAPAPPSTPAPEPKPAAPASVVTPLRPRPRIVPIQKSDDRDCEYDLA